MDAALQKGVTLNGLGQQLTQAQLTAASKAYANMPHRTQALLRNPTGYVFNGRRMVRNKTPGLMGLGRLGRLGQDDLTSDYTDLMNTTQYASDLNTSVITDSSGNAIENPQAGVPYAGGIYGTPTISPSGQVVYGPPSPGGLAPIAGPLNPSPNALSPTTAASSNPFAKLATAAGFDIFDAILGNTGVKPTTPLQTATLIPGVPNVILYCAGGFLLLAVVLGGSRRR